IRAFFFFYKQKPAKEVMLSSVGSGIFIRDIYYKGGGRTHGGRRVGKIFIILNLLTLLKGDNSF
ncbi:hypothetical protein ACM22_03275, partial [Helicobacter pylori]